MLLRVRENTMSGYGAVTGELSPTEIMARVSLRRLCRNNTLLPPTSGTTSAQSTLKTARPTPYIPKATPLRDLVLAEKYAAAVDAKGDLWLWGNGYWDESLRKSVQDQKEGERAKAQKSLRGKVCRSMPECQNSKLNAASVQNITSLAATTNKIYALSSSGDIYALASARSLQQSTPSEGGNPSSSGSSSWWSTFGLGSLANAFKTDPGVDYVRLQVNGEGLKKGEKYVR